MEFFIQKHDKKKNACYHLWVLLLLIFINTQAGATSSQSQEDPDIAYLKGLSIEDLLQTEITSASKKSEQLFDTASAVFVISQEDIRRTGSRNIPEALRMVPGLQVAHINANLWSITSRGFADWFSNKLLVMIDGRSVYTPLFSGVYWDIQDVVMEDIDRIEVIRGPGATVWGANAVNGVINVITKKASETRGGLLNVGFGNHEQALVEARYGKQIAESADVRVFAKGFQREPFKIEDGSDAHDAWQSMRTGFRADWQTESRDDFSLDGQLYTGEADMTLNLSGFLTPPYDRSTSETGTFSGGHLLSKWSHQLSTSSNIMLQAYYDRTQRDEVFVEETRDTIDFEFKHHWNPEGRHDIVWGAGYRWTSDDVDGTYTLTMIPDHRSDHLWSTFIQDDIMLVENCFWLTIGSKFEYNEYSGFEIQPSLRLRYKPSDSHLVWAAVSRAVRTPSRSDFHLLTNRATLDDSEGNLAIVRLLGNENFESEEVIAYETGYRWQPDPRFHLDFTGFYNDYDQVRDTETGTPSYETEPEPPHYVIPQIINNGIDGYTYGFEGLATWCPFDIWRISTSYAWLNLHLIKENGKTSGLEGASPEQQFQLRSYLDLPWQLHFDTELYYVDQLSSLDIDGYTRIDLRLEWTPDPQWALSINIENLLEDAHPEFEDSGGVATSEVPRIVYGQVTLRF